jgi:hypothetical protein
VLVNRNARGWLIATIVLLIASIGSYVVLAMRRDAIVSGGSIEGLIYGAVGSFFMLIALLLGLRKRLRTLQRIGPIPAGRAHTWMQAHVWLGLLSYPIILCHAGFAFGMPGSLTWVTMWVFTIVFVSGIVGLILQNLIPRTMLERLPLETIYEQHERVMETIAAQAKQIVETATAEAEEDAFELEAVPAGGVIAAPAASRIGAAKAQLRAFFEHDVRPFLTGEPNSVPQLSTDRVARTTFASVRSAMPVQLTAAVDDLELLVAERRQIAQQRVLFHWLHGWLLVHVPLSYALALLAIIHAVSALRYT